PNAIAVDKNRNIYVTGKSANNVSNPYNYDYVTVKYSLDGDSLWVRRYNGLADNNDVANGIAVDENGNVYVTGVSRGIGTSDDISTIKYSPNGDELWVRRYDGPNGWDGGNALAVDSAGNVYVSGYSRSGTLEDYITIKYSPNGDILWQIRYNGPVDSNDVANDMVMDDKRNIYVTGRSIGYETLQDYSTIKYVQYTCLAKPADANGDGLILLSDIATIINVLFKGQPAPGLFCGRDTNEDGTVLLSDVVYLINFLFKSGPAPSKNKECCL
ncbi:MAG TPA: SBBP repeat-containing protein, partial [candidate division Zixibacteria bacterium]|nr:SBBP repeat-containing protein [candidate division Zixibacteria bacterium]